MNTAVLAQELVAAGATDAAIAYDEHAHVLRVTVDAPVVLPIATTLYEFLTPFWPFAILQHGLLKWSRESVRIRWVIRIVPQPHPH